MSSSPAHDGAGAAGSAASASPSAEPLWVEGDADGPAGSLIDWALSQMEMPSRTAEICLDPNMARAWAELALSLHPLESVALASPDSTKVVEELVEVRRRLAELRPEIEPKLMRLTFTKLPDEEFRALVAEHPPTEEQAAAAADGGFDVDWDPNTFAPALLAAMCTRVEVGGRVADSLTAEESAALWTDPKTMNADRELLFQEALMAQLQPRPGVILHDLADTAPTLPPTSMQAGLEAVGQALARQRELDAIDAFVSSKLGGVQVVGLSGLL